MKKTRIWTGITIAMALFTFCCYFMPFLKINVDIFGEKIGSVSVSGFQMLEAAGNGDFPGNGWYVIGFVCAILMLLSAVIALAKRGILVSTIIFSVINIATTAAGVGTCISYLGDMYTTAAAFVLLIIAAVLTIALCVVTLVLPKPGKMPWQQQPMQPVQPVQQAPAFCTNCGAKLSPDAAFCPNCGAKRG